MCRSIVVLKNQQASSQQLSWLAPHGISKPFQELHVECLLNNGPLGSKWIIPLMSKKTDQHYFDPVLRHPWLLWPGDLPWTVFNISNFSRGDFCSLTQNSYSLSVPLYAPS
jgi:hypothetical protein